MFGPPAIPRSSEPRGGTKRGGPASRPESTCSNAVLRLIAYPTEPVRLSTIRLLLGAGLAALVLGAPVGAANAATVHWNETAKNGSASVMRFKVDSFTFTKTGWNAKVSLRNVSKTTIKIGNNFGAAIFSDHVTTDLSQVAGFALAQSFSPARPTELKPGQSWSGTISGTGHLKASSATRYARVVFGPLVGMPGQKGPVFWVTDHWLPLVPPPNPLAA